MGSFDMSAAHDVLREMAEEAHAFLGPEAEAQGFR
jgi:hypothetical protein